MIHLIDGTEWYFDDLVKENQRLADEIKKQRTVKKRQVDWANDQETLYGREKASDVGKPLKK